MISLIQFISSFVGSFIEILIQKEIHPAHNLKSSKELNMFVVYSWKQALKEKWNISN
jgi:hypothetical protein